MNDAQKTLGGLFLLTLFLVEGVAMYGGIMYVLDRPNRVTQEDLESVKTMEVIHHTKFDTLQLPITPITTEEFEKFQQLNNEIIDSGTP